MFTIQSESDRDATQIRLSQNGSIVVARLNNLSGTTLYQASKQAMVEVNVSGFDVKDNKLARYCEYRLAEFVGSFVNLSRYPNLTFRLFVFVLEASTSVKSAMANALTACLLAAGISMSRTLLALEYTKEGENYPQKVTEQPEWVVLDLHKGTVVEMDSREALGGSRQAEFVGACGGFREALRGWLQGEYIL